MSTEPATAADAGPGRGLDVDTVASALQNQRRRSIIRELATVEAVPLSRLSEHVAAREYGVDVADLGDQQAKRVYVSVYQTHVPHLDGLGIVEWDREANTVSRGAAHAPAHRALEAVADVLDTGAGDASTGTLLDRVRSALGWSQ